VDCRRAEPLLSAWLDGELAAPVAAELAAHVAGCPGCRGRSKELASARDLFQQMAPERSRLRAVDVLSRARKSVAPSLPLGRVERWLPLAAALALAVLGLWQGGLLEPETTERTEVRLGGFPGLDCGPGFGPDCRRLACFDAAECGDAAAGPWPPLRR
jgi:predicted anti-sigma-YlaC factor YlaD